MPVRKEIGATDPESGGFRLIVDDEVGAFGASYSPDATQLAYRDRGDGIVVGSAAGGAGTTIVPKDQVVDA